MLTIGPSTKSRNATAHRSESVSFPRRVDRNEVGAASAAIAGPPVGGEFVVSPEDDAAGLDVTAAPHAVHVTIERAISSTPHERDHSHRIHRSHRAARGPRAAPRRP